MEISFEEFDVTFLESSLNKSEKTQLDQLRLKGSKNAFLSRNSEKAKSYPIKKHFLLQTQLIFLFSPPVLDRELFDNWLFVINVKRDPRHGPDSTDFKGNECRKFIRSTDQLKMLITEIHLQDPRVSRRISQSSSSTKSKLDLVRKYQLI